ncbi:alginate lyase family protein [Citricoccus sp. SGAir0253]|uniref:alginate lyase family protein n=1 Tax=Citricoccus sp. SGAir0253 TaxID=2567881 RepID=UPI00143CF0A5|nr:alginate lyase family protein [Citricoccus sp. SGAir0253]
MDTRAETGTALDASDQAGETDPSEELAGPVDPDVAADPANPNSVYPCAGYGTLPRYNTVATNRSDVYNWYVFPSTKVGNGSGNINWTLDPHRDLGWKLWFSSLRWIGPSIEAGRAGDSKALAKAETIIRDWIRDHGTSWLADSDDMEANTHRLNVLTCFREVVMERNGGRLPSSYAWLTTSLHRHAEHNIARWSGAHNHGSMENKALLGLGCLLDRRDYQDHAIARVKKALPQQVSPEGLSNEAAPHYMHFNYRLLVQIGELMERCGHDARTVIRPLTVMGNNLAHMTNALGYYWQYGDSSVTKAPSNVPAQALYAATNGARGTKPTHRVRIFDAGFVFGRSSWGTPATGFANHPSWMLRGGSGREKKAHRGDLLQFLYTARGRDILVDGGQPGGVSTKWRGWAVGELAHNTIFVPSAKMSDGGRARLTRSSLPADGRADFVEMTQQFNSRGTRTRGVLVMPDPDLAIVLDRTVINDSSRRHTVQSLWSVPADQTSTWVSRSTVRSSRPGSSSQTTFVQVPFWGAPTVGKGETVIYRGAEAGIPRGHHYPRQLVRQPTDQITFSRHGNQVGTISVIAPALKSHQVRVTRGTYSNGSTKLTIKVGAKTTVVRITRGGYMSREG